MNLLIFLNIFNAMKKKAIIKIIGTQRLGEDRDKIEMTTVGTIEETAEHYILHYNEEQEPPLKPIHVKLSINKDEKRVEMMRSGAFGSLLIVERSKRNLCTYGTQYGDLLMGIYGKNIENSFGSKEGVFTFGYDIDVNGALTSQNEVKVKYKALKH